MNDDNKTSTGAFLGSPSAIGIAGKIYFEFTSPAEAKSQVHSYDIQMTCTSLTHSMNFARCCRLGSIVLHDCPTTTPLLKRYGSNDNQKREETGN